MLKQLLKYLIVCWTAAWILACNGSNERTYDEGANLYKQHCEHCHMEDGQGLEELYPPLAKADYLAMLGPNAACIIEYGLQGKILVNGVEFEMGMEPVKGLSRVEITNIVNYINNAWGNKQDFISLKEVEAALDACAEKEK